jgi:CRP-like cAMP-binding protein
MDDPSVLAASKLFSSMGPEALVRVASGASSARLERNDTLFSEGDHAREMFVLASGRIAVAKRSSDGRESLVALMEAGDLFGEMSMFDGERRPTSARALERSEVVRVPFEAVRRELEACPELLWEVASLLADRLREVSAALADAMLLDVTGRTAKRLLEIAGDADEFALPITQEELAGLVGASRERVNKAIAAFVRLGWLDQTDRRYRVVNRERLVQRAG